MKILHLTRHLDTGGIPRYVLDLSARLQARGHSVTVASTGGTQVPALEATGARHFKVPLSNKFEFGPNLWLSWKALLPVLRENKFDIVHAHTRIAQVLARLLERFHGIPAVTTCHGFFKPNLGRRLWPCWGRIAIAVSPAVAEHLQIAHRLPSNRIACIPNGIDTTGFDKHFTPEELLSLRSKLGIPPNDRVIGTVARLSTVKGLPYLLEAVALLSKTFPTIHCLIVGDGNQRQYLELISHRLDIAKHVTFAGAVQDTAPYLALMEVFVMSSLMEGLGLAILEAFAAGKPVVATRVGGIVNVVRDRENGILVPPGSGRDIAIATDILLSDKTLAQSLANGGRKTVENQFSLERMAGNIEKLYVDLHRLAQ